jgi:hypothetical protein
MKTFLAILVLTGLVSLAPGAATAGLPNPHCALPESDAVARYERVLPGSPYPCPSTGHRRWPEGIYSPQDK